MKLSSRFIKATREMCGFAHPVPAPYLRKTFTLETEPARAEITVCGLGFYEIRVNGRNITKGPLAPYISNPDDVCYYDRYDLTGLLKKGKNAVLLLLSIEKLPCLSFLKGSNLPLSSSKSSSPFITM